VLTLENYKKLAERHKLYQDDGEATLSEEEALATFTSNVVVTPQVTGVIDPRSMRAGDLAYGFDVGFRHEDPVVSRDVTNDLAQMFIASSTEQTQADAKRAIEFLRTQADRLEVDLRQREERLAEFRRAYGAGLPENIEANRERVRDLERDLARVDDDLREARARRSLLETQLRDTPAQRPVIDATGQPVVRGEDRLAAAQQELVAALARYSEDHPDVRRLRREIESLNSGLPSGAASAPNNPTYIQLQSQLSSTDTTIRDLTSRRYDLSSQIGRVQGAIYQSPQYEKQYADLVRDYELVKTQYEQMRAKQGTADITRRAAGADAAETYVLINPAFLPESPVEPDRVSLMFLAALLAIAAGLATATIRNSMDSTIRGNADVVALVGATPIGNVPLMLSAAELRKKRMSDLALVAGCVAAIGVVLLAVR
jgi:polysaccharide chain length determinant protein (PEP-CTERM system associated)